MDEQLNRVMEKACKLSQDRWCAFVNENFQLRRYTFAKNKACETCTP